MSRPCATARLGQIAMLCTKLAIDRRHLRSLRRGLVELGRGTTRTTGGRSRFSRCLRWTGRWSKATPSLWERQSQTAHEGQKKGQLITHHWKWYAPGRHGSSLLRSLRIPEHDSAQILRAGAGTRFTKQTQTRTPAAQQTGRHRRRRILPNEPGRGIPIRSITAVGPNYQTNRLQARIGCRPCLTV